MEPAPNRMPTNTNAMDMSLMHTNGLASWLHKLACRMVRHSGTAWARPELGLDWAVLTVIAAELVAVGIAFVALAAWSVLAACSELAAWSALAACSELAAWSASVALAAWFAWFALVDSAVVYCFRLR